VLKNYYFRLAVVSVGVLALSMGLAQLDTRWLRNPHVWIITLFFFISTALANLVFTKGDRQSREFIMKIMGVSMGRLLLCMVFVFIYSMANKPQSLAFACHFMLQYVIFTIVELLYILKFIKQPSAPPADPNTHNPS